jgi:hypothetical protein
MPEGGGMMSTLYPILLMLASIGCFCIAILAFPNVTGKIDWVILGFVLQAVALLARKEG